MIKTIVFTVLAVILLTTSMTSTVFATVSSGFSDKGFSIILPPAEVGNDDQQQDTIFVFDEQQNLVLLADMPVDLLASTNSPGDLLAGTSVSATTVIYDPINAANVEGCVDFEELVLGLQFERQTLIDADPILGATGTFYDNTLFRGIEPPPHPNADQVWFSDANSVCFDLRASTPGDTFRVITEGDHNTTVLWQVGVFDQSFADMTWPTTITQYNADVNPFNDCGGIPSNSCVNPDFPGVLGNTNGVSQIEISFTSPSCNEAMLFYSRAGLEIDDIFFDGELIATINSAEGVYVRYDLDLGAITAGPHTVLIDYVDRNGSSDDRHAFDAISLVCWEPKEPPILEVEIDVKPGSDPSSVSCKNNKGVVPVAVFGSESFDASTIDIELVSLSLVGSEPIIVTEAHDKIHLEDINEDGFDDAILHLEKDGVCLATEDAPKKESVDVILSGQSSDGIFEGIGDIRIVN